MSEIRLLLVDDHEVVRTGLRMLLENQADMIILATGTKALAGAFRLRGQRLFHHHVSGCLARRRRPGGLISQIGPIAKKWLASSVRTHWNRFAHGLYSVRQH